VQDLRSDLAAAILDIDIPTLEDKACNRRGCIDRSILPLLSNLNFDDYGYGSTITRIPGTLCRMVDMRRVM